MEDIISMIYVNNRREKRWGQTQTVWRYKQENFPDFCLDGAKAKSSDSEGEEEKVAGKLLQEAGWKGFESMRVIMSLVCSW